MREVVAWRRGAEVTRFGFGEAGDEKCGFLAPKATTSFPNTTKQHLAFPSSKKFGAIFFHPAFARMTCCCALKP